MRPVSEVAVAGILRTPFVQPGTLYADVPESELVRLIAGEILFSSRVDISLIDSVFLTSANRSSGPALGSVRSSCETLGIDKHFRVFSVCAGSFSDLVAVIEAVMRISSGESEAALILGVGVGKENFSEILPEGSAYPSRHVADRYPSTFFERGEYVRSSMEKARTYLEEGFRTGMASLSLPPYYETVIDHDDLRETEVTGTIRDISHSNDEPPSVLSCDYIAPPGSGLAALLLAAEDRVRSSTEKEIFSVYAFKHLGVPRELRGTGAALALDALLFECRLSMDKISVLEIHDSTAAQAIASLKALGSMSRARDIDPERTAGIPGSCRVNPSGGAFACGIVPSCSGIRMLAGLTEQLERRGCHFGAIACEDVQGEALALIVERK